MPKERIVPTVLPYEVHIGWSPNRDVQLGVDNFEGRSLLWLLYGSPGNIERIGQAITGMVASCGGDWTMAERVLGSTPQSTDELRTMVATTVLNLIEAGDITYTGIWAHLDREDCNKIIRILRRARDSAFGADA